MANRSESTHVASLVAVHSPDDGGWYCEMWRHLDDRKRSIVDHDTLDHIHQSAELALAEGHERARREGMRVFFETIDA